MSAWTEAESAREEASSAKEQVASRAEEVQQRRLGLGQVIRIKTHAKYTKINAAPP